MSNFFDKQNRLKPGFSTRTWQDLPAGLLVPPGSVSRKKQLRTEFQETPLECHKKTRTVEMPKPVYNAFRMEMARLESKHLDTATDMTHVLAFEKEASTLCEEYGVTLALAVDGENNIIVQTEELIVESAGEVELYQQYSNALHYGEKVMDDVALLYKPSETMTDKEWQVLDE